MQITGTMSGTLAVGDPWPIGYGTCSTGCPTCTCCNQGCQFREGTGRFIVITPMQREAIFDPPKMKLPPRRPFHQRINRRPWERR